jgi:hypothetical protein
MPKFTIDLTQNAVDKLQAQVQRTNETNGTDLTTQQWIVLHLQELAIARDLSTAVQSLQQQQQEDADATLQAAIRAKRDQLLQELESA